MKTNPSDPNGVQLKSKISVSDGYLRVDRYRVAHQLYGGGWSQVLEREVMSRGAVTGVLLFDPTRQEVVLVEQFRTGSNSSTPVTAPRDITSRSSTWLHPPPYS